MKNYLIGYDLNRPRSNGAYPELDAAIKKYGNYIHPVDSTWIVKTDSSASEIRDNLKAHVDEGDKLLVLQLTGVASWFGLSVEESNWLKASPR